MYPFYEKAVKAGITTLCIHKGLLPPDYEKSFAGVWEYATAWDIGKAAKDWPQMTFVIYHSALRAFLELPDQAWAEFETTGRIKWATDLAEIPAEVRGDQCLRRARHVFRQFGGGASEVLGRLGGHAGQGLRGGPRALGHRLASGMDRRNGRSKRCGGWRSPRTCRRSMASRLSATPTARPSR